MGRGFTAALMALSLSGCGLLLDPEPDAGVVDAGMDAGVVDAGSDAGALDGGAPECVTGSDCPSDPCGADLCQDGFCVPGPRTVCDDGIPCTEDLCDGEGGCVHIPSEGSCSGEDTGCAGNRCVPGAGCVLVAIDACDDEVPCTRDACDLDTGVCEHDEDDEACPAGQACDDETGCEPLECDSGQPCPSRPCGTAVCEGGECVPTNAPSGTPCSVTNFCQVSGVCSEGGVCETELRSCDDGNPCTQDTCRPDLSQCVTQPNVGRACDAEGCFAGTCDAGGECAPTADLCVSAPNLCVDRDCVAGGCIERTPCAGQNRECGSAGACGQCLPGFLDCVGDATCERRAMFGPCPASDGGVIPTVDASVKLDAEPPCISTSGPVCRLSNLVDCDGDGCCECLAPNNTCSPGPGSTCVPSECGTAGTSCAASEECCCGVCVDPTAITCGSCPSASTP